MQEAGSPACIAIIVSKIFSSLRRLSSSFQNDFEVMDEQSGKSKEQEVMGEGIGELEIKESGGARPGRAVSNNLAFALAVIFFF